MNGLNLIGWRQWAQSEISRGSFQHSRGRSTQGDLLPVSSYLSAISLVALKTASFGVKRCPQQLHLAVGWVSHCSRSKRYRLTIGFLLWWSVTTPRDHPSIWRVNAIPWLVAPVTLVPRAGRSRDSTSPH